MPISPHVARLRSLVGPELSDGDEVAEVRWVAPTACSSVPLHRLAQALLRDPGVTGDDGAGASVSP